MLLMEFRFYVPHHTKIGHFRETCLHFINRFDFAMKEKSKLYAFMLK